MGNIGKHFTLTTILILAVVAVVLGYFILSSAGVNIPFSLTNKDETTNPSANELTAEEKAVLNIPGSDEKDKLKSHSAQVDKLAVTTSILDVTNCKPSPVVIELQEGQTFSIRNTGKSNITMAVDAEHIYTILPGGLKELKADFGKGDGVYGYNCDQSPKTSGIMYIVPKHD